MACDVGWHFSRATMDFPMYVCMVHVFPPTVQGGGMGDRTGILALQESRAEGLSTLPGLLAGLFVPYTTPLR